MALITSARIQELKAKIKAECLRRSKTGSVAQYGQGTYDFTAIPDKNVIVAKEHYEKMAVPLNAINSDNQPYVNGERVASETEILNMEAKVAIYESRSITDNQASDCKSSCTGLCYSCTGQCVSACSGCSGCSGCGGACSYGCSGGCSGCSGCGNACSSGCGGTCSFNCSSVCARTST